MANKIYVANEQTVQSVKTEVNSIHSKVGSGSDASSASTVFGKLNGIGAKVSDLLAPLAQKIGNTADTASQQTLFGKLKAVKDDVSRINTNTVRGAVKSVQRGIVTFNDNDYSSRNEKYIDRTVTISSVNPSKSLILLNNSLAGTSNTATTSDGTVWAHEMRGEQSTVKSFDATNFVLTPCYQKYQDGRNPSSSGTTRYGSVSWQVIEFF